MINEKQFTLDWLQFIEQVKDRVSRGEMEEFEYQLKTNTKSGKRVTFLIKVVADEREPGVVVQLITKKKKEA